MCGIAGSISPAAVPPHTLPAMLAQVDNRGPDDQGTWSHCCGVSGAHLAFGHTRLSILDVTARGHQPFVTADRSGVLTYNGEVYNYRELRAELQAEGVEFHTGTDTEVVLQALHNWGVQTAVPRFNGMFALAYADLRDGSVWLARDRLGIKPLFIAATRAGGLAFASEQKALLAHPGVCADIDMHATLSLLLYERFDGSETPYKSSRLFLPGRILELRHGRQHWHTYFDLQRDLDLDAITDQQRSLQGSVSAFEQQLTASVEQHLVSDAPLAAMCSGGMDSGLVTAMAARRHPNLVAYVADMQGMGGEERRRAGLIAEHVGAELRPVDISGDTFLRALPDAIAANDQPLFFAQDVAAMLIAQQMRADGFKVLLTGDGADELFGGYTWHADAYYRWSRLAWRARWIPDNAFTRRLGRRVPALAPVNLDHEMAGFALHTQAFDYVATPLNTAVVAGMGRTLRQRRLFAQLQALAPAQRAFLSKNFEDVYVHMRECLNALDKMTMRYSIEARVPFLENHLMTLGFGLPVDHKFHRGQRKVLINRVAARWLPKDVLNLPKIGFNAPAEMWRGAVGFLDHGHVAELLKWPSGCQQDIYQLLNRKPYFMFRLLGCELWLRMRLDGDSAADLGEALLSTSV